MISKIYHNTFDKFILASLWTRFHISVQRTVERQFVFCEINVFCRALSSGKQMNIIDFLIFQWLNLDHLPS